MSYIDKQGKLPTHQDWVLAYVHANDENKQDFIIFLQNLIDACKANNGAVVFPIPITKQTRDTLDFEINKINELGYSNLTQEQISQLTYTELQQHVFLEYILSNFAVDLVTATSQEIVSGRSNLFNGLPEFNQQYLIDELYANFFYSTLDDVNNVASSYSEPDNDVGDYTHQQDDGSQDETVQNTSGNYGFMSIPNQQHEQHDKLGTGFGFDKG